MAPEALAADLLFHDHILFTTFHAPRGPRTRSTCHSPRLAACRYLPRAASAPGKPFSPPAAATLPSPHTSPLLCRLGTGSHCSTGCWLPLTLHLPLSRSCGHSGADAHSVADRMEQQFLCTPYSEKFKTCYFCIPGLSTHGSVPSASTALGCCHDDSKSPTAKEPEYKSGKAKRSFTVMQGLCTLAQVEQATTTVPSDTNEQARERPLGKPRRSQSRRGNSGEVSKEGN